ncbi:hypothetical protein NPIL_482971 [Nephila pilipes]|uniref:Uncharacterized protein n=1 Tax=Nephila pilipes TaxID=299642 RepID=A0A8X6QD12_NEPPI|nr:hypothetical protein NPIL_482971 [Nephila pilipes]
MCYSTCSLGEALYSESAYASRCVLAAGRSRSSNCCRGHSVNAVESQEHISARTTRSGGYPNSPRGLVPPPLPLLNFHHILCLPPECFPVHGNKECNYSSLLRRERTRCLFA